MATIIKVVGENWCGFTVSAWEAIPNDPLNGIQYQKVDCKPLAGQPPVSESDKTTYCDNAAGYPAFMDTSGATCAAGFDNVDGKKFADVEARMRTGALCALPPTTTS